MKIEELTPEQPITIFTILKDQKLEFPSTVLETVPRKHTIICSPIIRDDKIVAFKSQDLQVHIIVTQQDQKPHIFLNVSINTAKRDDGSFCYTVTTTADSKEFNRRGAFRCFVGADTSVNIGTKFNTVEATIKDVSATGFAITAGANVDFHKNELIHAILNDFIDETSKNYSFHLFGNIVRTQKLENGNIVYGCQFTNKIVGMDKYIMEKERVRLQRSRGNSNFTLKKSN